MKSIRVHRFGGPEELQLDDIRVPAPGAGEVLVKVDAAGVNYADTHQRKGIFRFTEAMPAPIGIEGAGRVSAVGTGVSAFREGDAVAWSSTQGSYAEYAVVPAERLIAIPAGLDTRQAAAAMLQGMTAHSLLYGACALKPGDTCLIHAAAGGVGLLLVQLAKRCGARVIGTVSTEAKKALALAAGADEVILYSRDDFAAETLRLTEGRGVRAVYDSVGKTTFEKSLACLAPLGYLVMYGESSGAVPPFDPVLLRRGALFVTRAIVLYYIADRASLEWRAGEILNWVKDGSLKLRIEKTLPLADARTAHTAIESRQTTGKWLLIP